MALAAFTFVMTLLLVIVVYWLLEARPARASRERLRLRLGAPVEGHAPLQVMKTGLATTPGEPRLLAAWRRHVAQSLRAWGVEDATRVCRRTILAMLVVCGAALFGGARPGTVIVLAAVTAIGPVAWLRRRREIRLHALEEMFPGAVELLARALRAGHAFSSAAAMVAEELPEPVAGEFRIMFEQQNFGMPVPEVLRALAERVPLMDVRFFVTAVLTQRETGGNLSQVLDNLAGVMRDRVRVNRQLQVMTAQGRMTGRVLGVFPVVLAVCLLYWSPAGIQMLLHDPLGQQMLMAAATLQLVGYFTIRRITRVEY